MLLAGLHGRAAGGPAQEVRGDQAVRHALRRGRQEDKGVQVCLVDRWFCSKLMDQQDKCIFQVPSEGPDEHDPGVQEPRGGGVGGARVLGRPPLQDVQLPRPNNEGH